ncbi:MAG: hypothetical protein ACREQM_11310 [Candidatus Dormibacteraceae bacterium]
MRWIEAATDAVAGAGVTRLLGHAGIWGAGLLQVVALALLLRDSAPARKGRPVRSDG